MRAMLLAGVTALSFAGTAHANYVLTFSQSGSNVVATGNGSIDVADLSSPGSVNEVARVNPSEATFVSGYGDSAVNLYELSEYDYGYNPYSFGSAGVTTPNSGSVQQVGLSDLSSKNSEAIQLSVSVGYVSGTPISTSSVYNNATLVSLGLNPGTYTYEFGLRGLEIFTIQIGPVAPPPNSVPEPATLALLALPLGLAGLLVARRR